MEKPTVVKEIVKGDRIFKEMSDGTVCVESARKSNGTLYGDYVVIDGEITEEKLARAKAEIIESACNNLRAIAERREDFFIIKPNSVGYKFFLPTVDEDYQ